jgi:hypothetical protein
LFVDASKAIEASPRFRVGSAGKPTIRAIDQPETGFMNQGGRLKRPR